MSRNFDVIIVVPADTEGFPDTQQVTAEVNANTSHVMIKQPRIPAVCGHDDVLMLTRKQAIQLRDGLHHLLGDG